MTDNEPPSSSSSSSLASSQIRSEWSLESKCYIVTGGTKGIGLAVTRSLLAHGARFVLICARNPLDIESTVQTLRSDFQLLLAPSSSTTTSTTNGDDEGEQKNNNLNGSAALSSYRIGGVACDVSTSDGRDILLSTARETFGDELHGLINNVGINIRETILNQREEEYHSIMKTNVDSAYFLCKRLQPMLQNAASSGSGRMSVGGSTVVNVASCAGLMSSGTGAAYGTSKAALIHLTKILACEWAKFNIRVNAVAPWMTMTPMLEDAVRSDPTTLDKVKDWTPLHRLASAEEVASPVVFLCMPCSSYVTGQCLAIDGGLSAQGFDGPCVT